MMFRRNIEASGIIPMLIRSFLFGRKFSLRRIRSGVIGIACSLIPLVLIFVVANGMISGITMRFIETGTYHLQLLARRPGNEATIPETLADLDAVDGILHAFPEVRGTALLAGGIGHSGAQLRGVDPDIYKLDENFARYLDIVDGDFDLDGERKLLLGENLASQLEIGVGDDVRLITAQTRERIIPRVSHFTVAGIISSGYRELDSLWIFISETDARRVIPRNELREIIGIKVDSPFTLGSSSQKLLFTQTDGGATGQSQHGRIFQEIRGRTDEDWRLFTWFDLERGQYQGFITSRNLLLFIFMLIVLVATMNVSSTMIMLVLEKQEEIAILKALGIRNKQIFLVFLVCGGVTGGIGAVIGLSIGALAAYGVNSIVVFLEYIVNGIGYIAALLTSPGELYLPIELFNPEFYLNKVPINLRFSDLLVMALIILLLSVIMTFLPARRAVQLSPLTLLHRQ